MSGQNRIAECGVFGEIAAPFHCRAELRLLAVLRGTLTLRFVSGEITLREGDVEVVNIDEPVCMDTGGEAPWVVVMTIDGAFLARHCERIGDYTFNCNAANQYAMSVPQEKKEALRRSFERAVGCFRFAKDPDALQQALLETAEVLICNFNNIDNVLDGVRHSGAHLSRVKRLEDFLKNNFGGQVSLAELSRREYLNASFLSSLINRVLGRSFKSILNYYRIRHAVGLLLTTDYCMDRVAEESGFVDYKNFGKNFQRHMRVSPTDFRRLNRQVPPRFVRLDEAESAEVLEQFASRSEPLFRVGGRCLTPNPCTAPSVFSCMLTEFSTVWISDFLTGLFENGKADLSEETAKECPVSAVSVPVPGIRPVTEFIAEMGPSLEILGTGCVFSRTAESLNLLCWNRVPLPADEAKRLLEDLKNYETLCATPHLSRRIRVSLGKAEDSSLTVTRTLDHRAEKVYHLLRSAESGEKMPLRTGQALSQAAMPSCEIAQTEPGEIVLELLLRPFCVTMVRIIPREGRG